MSFKMTFELGLMCDKSKTCGGGEVFGIQEWKETVLHAPQIHFISLQPTHKENFVDSSLDVRQGQMSN